MRGSILALAVLVVSTGASGQSLDRRVELEDFAVRPTPSTGSSNGDPGIDQIGAASSEKVAPAPVGRDRAVASSQNRSSPDVGMVQVPRSEGQPTQIVREEGEGRRIDPDALSSPDQSAPQAVTVLGGQDRCDPQADQSLYRACLRIIERRAAEYAAPTAPKLSPEEALLAQRRADDEDSGTLTIEQRIRRASQNAPDAELSSNQELASLILPGTAGVPVEPTQDEASLRAEEVEAVLKAIGLPVPPQP